jgi:uncharacterized protein
VTADWGPSPPRRSLLLPPVLSPSRRGPGDQLLAAVTAWVLALALALLGPAGAAWALAVGDLPPQPPATHVLDTAAVLSRAGSGEIDRLLQAFSADRVDARLITVNRLDYGLSLDQLGQELIDRWHSSSAEAGGSSPPLLLLLIDTHTRAASVVAAPALERQLPADLLRSTARTTMAQPLREGERYRQATVDALQRLSTVLEGGEDPGEPVVLEAPVVESNIPSREETRSSNAFSWVVVLLVVGTLVPMLTWWVFSR